MLMPSYLYEEVGLVAQMLIVVANTGSEPWTLKLKKWQE